MIRLHISDNLTPNQKVPTRMVTRYETEPELVAHPDLAGFKIESVLRSLANDPSFTPDGRTLAKKALVEGDTSSFWPLNDELFATGHPLAGKYRLLNAVHAIHLDRALGHAISALTPAVGHPLQAVEHLRRTLNGFGTPHPKAVGSIGLLQQQGHTAEELMKSVNRHAQRLSRQQLQRLGHVQPEQVVEWAKNPDADDPEVYRQKDAPIKYGWQKPERGTLTPEQAEIFGNALHNRDWAGFGALGDHLAENGFPNAGSVLSRFAEKGPDADPAVGWTGGFQRYAHLPDNGFRYAVLRDGSDLVHHLQVNAPDGLGYQFWHREKPVKNRLEKLIEKLKYTTFQSDPSHSTLNTPTEQANARKFVTQLVGHYQKGPLSDPSRQMWLDRLHSDFERARLYQPIEQSHADAHSLAAYLAGRLPHATVSAHFLHFHPVGQEFAQRLGAAGVPLDAFHSGDEQLVTVGRPNSPQPPEKAPTPTRESNQPVPSLLDQPAPLAVPKPASGYDPVKRQPKPAVEMYEVVREALKYGTPQKKAKSKPYHFYVEPSGRSDKPFRSVVVRRKGGQGFPLFRTLHATEDDANETGARLVQKLTQMMVAPKTQPAGEEPAKYAATVRRPVHPLVRGTRLAIALKSLAKDANPTVSTLAKNVLRDGDTNSLLVLGDAFDKENGGEYSDHPLAGAYDWRGAARRLHLDAAIHPLLDRYAEEDIVPNPTIPDYITRSVAKQAAGRDILNYGTMLPSQIDRLAHLRLVAGDHLPDYTEDELRASLRRHGLNAVDAHARTERQHETASTGRIRDIFREMRQQRVNAVRQGAVSPTPTRVHEESDWHDPETPEALAASRFRNKTGEVPAKYRNSPVLSDFISAVRQVRSTNQEVRRELAQEQFKALKLKLLSIRDAIADSPVTASANTAQEVAHNGDLDRVRAAAALLGLQTNSPSLLLFHEGEGDTDSLFKLSVSGSAEKLRKRLDEAGLPNRTLLPTDTGWDAVILSPNHSLNDRIAQFAQSVGAPLEVSSGRAEVIGGGDEAEGDKSSRKSYRSIIRQFERKQNANLPETAGNASNPPANQPAPPAVAPTRQPAPSGATGPTTTTVPTA